MHTVSKKKITITSLPRLSNGGSLERKKNRALVIPPHCVVLPMHRAHFPFSDAINNLFHVRRGSRKELQSHVEYVFIL